MVMHLELQAHLLAGERHRAADVLLRIDRRHGKIAALHAGPMPAVAVLIMLARIPRTFIAIDLIGAAIHGRAVGDVVEDEEFIFRAEQRRVSYA